MDAMPESMPRDHIFALDLDFDFEAQLMAIRGLLYRNRLADGESRDEIKRIDDHARHLKGLPSEWAVDEWVDRIHGAVYRSAAHSMAAVGMLAPLLETIFFRCFQAIGTRFCGTALPSPSHERWRVDHAVRWDCHFVATGSGPQKDLVRGIVQLSDAVGLAVGLPSDIKPFLSALFGYRNKMFHHGVEWPLTERQLFAKRIVNEGWPMSWFPNASTDNVPWVFYLSDEFVDHGLAITEQVLDAIGCFVRDTLPSGEGSPS